MKILVVYPPDDVPVSYETGKKYIYKNYSGVVKEIYPNHGLNSMVIVFEDNAELQIGNMPCEYFVKLECSNDVPF